MRTYLKKENQKVKQIWGHPWDIEKEFVAPNGKELQYPSAPAYYMIKITFDIDAHLGFMSS